MAARGRGKSPSGQARPKHGCSRQHIPNGDLQLHGLHIRDRDDLDQIRASGPSVRIDSVVVSKGFSKMLIFKKKPVHEVGTYTWATDTLAFQSSNVYIQSSPSPQRGLSAADARD